MSRGHQPGLLFALREGDGIDYAFIMFPSLIEDSWGEYGQRTGFAKVSGLRERIWLSSDVFIGRPSNGQLMMTVVSFTSFSSAIMLVLILWVAEEKSMR